MKIVALISFFIVCYISASSQAFPEFYELINKADSAYQAKNYSLSVSYYENIILLPEAEKPEIIGRLYYDMACVYALAQDAKNALNYLEKSFKTFNAKRNTNPVSAAHIMSDTDLDFIRETDRFKKILEKYYPASIFPFITSRNISYSNLLEYIRYASGFAQSVISIQNKIIYWDQSDNKFTFNDARLELPVLEGLSEKTIEFKDCRFELNFIWTNYSESASAVCKTLQFDNCVFKGRVFILGTSFVYPPKFTRCDFDGQLVLHMIAKPDNDYSWLIIKDCSFRFASIQIESEPKVSISIEECATKDSSDFIISAKNVRTSDLIGNEFHKKNLRINLHSVDILNFNDNELNNLQITNTNIQSEFNLQKAAITEKLLLYRTYFSVDAPIHNINWDQISNLKLGIFIPVDTSYILNLDKGIINYPNIFQHQRLTGEQQEAISDDEKFREIMGLYSMFLNLYKIKNDIESYNSCFIEVKELQTKRLKYLYHSNKTFESYFRWKLSQLLKYYVRYGTDPARAIVISVYIILLFGGFYFFFPSDWDKTSKPKLVQNFKDFVQKNDKGYIKPFFILLGGFSMSLLNAFTLSLNAFVTLGFGNIPTHGLARYFCILEGFLGWFLLSIFTVAMINQVL